MPRKFNFKKDISRPFMRGVVHPLVDVARPFVNQGLAALKDKGLALAKDYGTQALQTLAETPNLNFVLLAVFVEKKVNRNSRYFIRANIFCL